MATSTKSSVSTKSSTPPKPSSKSEKKMADPVTQVPPRPAPPPGAVAQTIPGAPPPPPEGPAAPAAKSKPKRGLDLSGLSDEAKAKVEALRKSLAEERKKVATDLAAKEKAQLEALGVKVPERKPAAARAVGTNGLNPEFKVTMGPDLSSGWNKEEFKAVQKIVQEKENANTPLTLKEFLATEGVEGWPWFRHRFIRGGLRLNGKTFTEIVNKGAAA